MKQHNMKLQQKYFEYVKDGVKRIELRLYDKKRAQIQLGDTIIFVNANTGEEISVLVVGLLLYESFEKLISDFDISLLSDPVLSKADLLNAINEIYPPEKQSKFSVLGIRIEIRQK